MMGLFGSPGNAAQSRGRRPSMYTMLATGLLTYLATHPDKLNSLLRKFQQRGRGDAAESWVGMGPNRQLRPEDVQAVLDPEDLQELSRRTGLSPQQVSAGLADVMPNMVDKLTPHGEVPEPNALQQGIEFLRRSLMR